MVPSCCQLRMSWPVVQLDPPHWSMCLKGRCQHSQWGTTMTKSTLLQHRLILVTSYRRSVILTHLTEADFLQPGHTAVTGTLGLKPHTITPNTCFRVESATVVLDTAQSNVLSCKELAPAILTQCGVITGIVPRLYQRSDMGRPCMECRGPTEEQVWEFRICYNCRGPTSQFCAEHAGSCCNNAAAPRNRRGWSRAPGVENGWTMDDDETMDDDDFNEVIGNAPQSPTTRSSQLSTSGLSNGFVRIRPIVS